ncbi:hypothetical protein D3C79_897140 [compost metagenome]
MLRGGWADTDAYCLAQIELTLHDGADICRCQPGEALDVAVEKVGGLALMGNLCEQGCQVLVLCHIAQQLPCQLLARHLQLGLGWPLFDELAQQGFN